MAFWHRINKTKLKSLTHQFRRHCVVQKPCASLLSHTVFASRPYDSENPFLDFHKSPPLFCSNARFFSSGKFVKQEDASQNAHRLNDQITARVVRIVSDEGHKVVSLREAIEQAKKLELDLVEVDRSADPPVCRLMDFHRESYERSRKAKERAKSKAELTLRKGSHKEVRFSEKTEQKDLQIKADLVKRLMDDRYRVKCMVVSINKKAPPKAATEEDFQRIREEEERQKAVMGEVLSRLTALIEKEAIIESGPHVEKRQAYVVVRHVKFGPSKKGGGKKKANKQVNLEETEDDALSEADGIDNDEVDDVFNIGNNGSQESINHQAHDSHLPPSPPTPSSLTDNRYKKPDPRTRFQSPASTINRYSGQRDSSRSQHLNHRSRQVVSDSTYFRDLNPNEKPNQDPSSSTRSGN